MNYRIANRIANRIAKLSGIIHFQKLFLKSYRELVIIVVSMAFFAGCAAGTAIKQTEKDMKKAIEFRAVTDISIAEDSESINILIKGNRVLVYTSVKQPFPLSVILYFPETILDNVKRELAPSSNMIGSIIGSIKTSELTENGHIVKIEISLKEDASYKVISEGKNLKVSFKKAPEISHSAISPAPPEPEHLPDKPAVAAYEQPEQEQSEADISKPALINRIDFLSEDAGRSTIIVGVTAPVKHKIRKVTDKKLQLELFNTRLPDYRKLPLITTRFESAVDRITPVQTLAMKNMSMLVIELRERVPYFIEQTDKLLLIHFEASSISPKPFEEAKLPAWKKILAQTAPEIEKKEAAKKTQGKVEEKISRPEKVKKYTGEKIALDFYDTDIKNVFRILMEVSGKNFAIDKNVTGRVTLTLEKPVPWDQALSLILKMNQLGQTSEENIIRIATLETLKKEESFKHAEITAAQKAREEQKILEPLITEYIAINYANAKTEMLPHLQTIITKDRGSVTVDERTNLVIITDVPEKIEQAKAIVKQLDKVTPQVIIEARIVEASTNFSREIGTEWNIGGGIQQDDDRAGIGPQRSYDVLGGTYGYDMAMNFPVAAVNPASIGFNFLRIAGTPLLLNAKLMAMESEGEGKVISSPKIVTLDNKKAVIKQGLRYPYIKMDEAGNPTTQFEDIDLLLEVTPHVTPDRRISMIINITKKDIGALYEAGRSFTTKEASTELLINDGNTVVIGGIIKTTNQFGSQGVPWLSKIPILGWLFKSQSKSRDKEELLIFITPRIVHLEQRDLIE